DFAVADLAVGVADRDCAGRARARDRQRRPADLEERRRDAGSLAREPGHELAPRVEVRGRLSCFAAHAVVPEREARARRSVEEPDALGETLLPLNAGVVARQEERREVDLDLAMIPRVEALRNFAEVPRRIEAVDATDRECVVCARRLALEAKLRLALA